MILNGSSLSILPSIGLSVLSESDQRTLACLGGMFACVFEG